MVAEAGSLLNSIQTGTFPVPADFLTSSPSSSQGNLTASTAEGGLLADLVDLSENARAHLEDGREALSSLREGRGDLIKEEVELIREQLQQIRKELGFLKKLLQNANEDQARPLSEGIEHLGRNLESIGHRIGLIQPGEEIQIEQRSTTIEATTLSFSFNRVATIETADGQRAEISQSLNIELSFLRISDSSQSLTVSAGDDGATEVAFSSQESSLIFAQLNVTQENSLTLSAPLQQGGHLPHLEDNPFLELAEDIAESAKSFAELVEDFQERFEDDDRIPPGLSQVIDRLLAAAFEQGSLHHLDEVA